MAEIRHFLARYCVMIAIAAMIVVRLIRSGFKPTRVPPQ